MTLSFSYLSRLIAFACGCWLISTSSDQIAAQSKGAESWEDETSFMALQLRAQGTTNKGLGWLALSASMAGLKFNFNNGRLQDKNDNEEKEDYV